MHTWLGFEWYYTMPLCNCTAPTEKNFSTKNAKNTQIITFPCHLSLEKMPQIINNKHRGVYHRGIAVPPVLSGEQACASRKH